MNKYKITIKSTFSDYFTGYQDKEDTAVLFLDESNCNCKNSKKCIIHNPPQGYEVEKIEGITNILKNPVVKTINGQLSVEDVAEICYKLFRHTPSGELFRWEKRHYIDFINTLINKSKNISDN